MFRDSNSVDRLGAELQKKSRQIDMLDSQLNKVKQELDAAKCQITELKKDNIAKTSRCSELEATTERLSRDVKQRDQKIATIQGQVDSLKPTARSSPAHTRSQPGTPASPASATPSETDHLRAQVTQLQSEIDRLSINTSTTPTATTAGDALPSPQQRRGFGTTSFFGGSTATADIVKIRALTNDVATWKTKADGLMSELKISQRKAAAAIADGARAAERAALAADAQLRAESQLKTAQAEISQLRDLADQSSKDLKTQLKRSEGDAARFAADADKVSSQADVLQRRIDALLTEKSSLELSLSDAVAAAAKARDTVRLVNADKAELEKQLDDKAVQLAAAWAEGERLKSAKETADAQFTALTDKLTSAHEVAAAQEARAKELAGMAGAESDSSQEALRQVRAMQERAEAAELAAEALKAKIVVLENAVDAAKEQQKVTTNALEATHAQLADVTKEGSESAAGRAAAVSAHAKLEVRVEDLTAQLASRDATITELAEVMEALRSDLDLTRKELAASQILVNNAEDALGTVKSKSAVEMSGMHGTLESQSQDLDKAMKAVEAAEEVAKDAVAARENALRAQSKSLAEMAVLKNELEEIRASAESEAERADALSQLLNDREAELSRVRDELSAAEVQARQSQSLEEQSLADKIRLEETHGRLTAAMQEATALKEELAAKQIALDAARATVKDREATIEKLQKELHEAAIRYEEQATVLMDAEERIGKYEDQSVEDKMKIGDSKGVARDAEMAAAGARKEAEEVMVELQRAREEIRDAEERLDAANKTIVTLTDALDDARGSADVDLAYRRRAAELEEEVKAQAEALEAAQMDIATEKQKATEAILRAASSESPTKSPRKRSVSPRKTPRNNNSNTSRSGREGVNTDDDAVLATSLVSSAFKNVLNSIRKDKKAGDGNDDDLI